MVKSILQWSLVIVAVTEVGSGQNVRPVPVYPGAQLVLEKHEGEESVCCDFVSKDSYAKVLSFYEEKLRTKPMDLKTIAARYPALSPQIRQLEAQLPSSVVFCGFALSEFKVQSGLAAELFEVVSTPDGVRFSIGEQSLTGPDAGFATTWNEKTGGLTPEEKRRIEQRPANSSSAQEERQEQGRQDIADASHRANMGSALEKLLALEKIRLYPGARLKNVRQGDYGEEGGAYFFVYKVKAKKLTVSKFYELLATTCVTATVEESEEGEGGGTVLLTFTYPDSCPGFDELRKTDEAHGR